MLLTRAVLSCSLISNESTAHNTGGPTARADRYLAPSWFTGTVFNRLVARLTKMGVSVWGSRVLLVRGRTSGEIRANVVNVLTHDGERYLVAPRGTTQWVRNIRAAGKADLKVGRRIEPVVAEELSDDAKPAVLRAYLRRWKWEVGQFFDGVGPDAPDDELLRIASGYPVFRLLA
jgi:deazaflavin-dependent oxidoreductase (nitroreductase family)